MTRDHKIRILISHLSGAARETEKLRLLTHPTLVSERFKVRWILLQRRQS